MKKIVAILCTFCLILSAFAQKSAHFGAAKYAPADGKKLLIIGQDLGAVGGMDTYKEGYVDSITTHIPAGVTSYTSIPSLGGLKTMANWGSGDVKAQAYLEDATFKNSFIVIGLYLVNQLDAITAGTHDASIKELAQWVKGQNRPVFIRVGYEFEGSWNSYDPTKFKNAWQYIVHVFDKENVKNVAYVWQSAGLGGVNIDQWYPGDEYVNWVGYSRFEGNPGQNMIDFAKLHKKPCMIAEATPRRDLKKMPFEDHWNVYFKPLFQTIYDNKEIKALAYINVNWDIQPMWKGQGWGDSRVFANPFVKQSWLTEIAKTPWITANDSLFANLGHQYWLNSTIATKDEIFLSENHNIEVSGNETLQISLDDKTMMYGIVIYNIEGKILYQNQEKTISYSVSNLDFTNKMVLISVKTDKGICNKKYQITR
jgi:hypothetical protein